MLTHRRVFVSVLKQLVSWLHVDANQDRGVFQRINDLPRRDTYYVRYRLDRSGHLSMTIDYENEHGLMLDFDTKTRSEMFSQIDATSRQISGLLASDFPGTLGICSAWVAECLSNALCRSISESLEITIVISTLRTNFRMALIGRSAGARTLINHVFDYSPVLHQKVLPDNKLIELFHDYHGMSHCLFMDQQADLSQIMFQDDIWVPDPTFVSLTAFRVALGGNQDDCSAIAIKNNGDINIFVFDPNQPDRYHVSIYPSPYKEKACCRVADLDEDQLNISLLLLAKQQIKHS